MGNRYVTVPAFIVAVLLWPGAASAQTTEFYVVQDATTKKCTIVETRPTDKTVVVIGDKAYVSREEADKQLKVVCKD